jgi:hypothetical protein
MLELIRVFLGYCMDCRLPTVVGEFRLPGWKHSFNCCTSCLQKQIQKLHNEMNAMAQMDLDRLPVLPRGDSWKEGM